MSPDATSSLDDFLRTHARLITRLYHDARASRWSLTERRFAESLYRSVAHGCRRGSTKPEVVAEERYLAALHVEDLALACACIDGDDEAWEHFVAVQRPQLYAAARATGNDDRAREIADSLYADLYGLDERGGKRRSLLEYFHGRSRLGTWLRAILAQRYVDALRASARTRPLDVLDHDSTPVPQDLGAGASTNILAPGVSADPSRVRYLAVLQLAVRAELGSLDSRDRLRLTCYYVQDLTLAEIGRLLGEHEATVSRKLGRVRRQLRARIEERLRTTQGLSDAEINDCFACALGEWPFDLTSAMSSEQR